MLKSTPSQTVALAKREEEHAGNIERLEAAQAAKLQAKENEFSLALQLALCRPAQPVCSEGNDGAKAATATVNTTGSDGGSESAGKEGIASPTPRSTTASTTSDTDVELSKRTTMATTTTTTNSLLSSFSPR